jgi:hypothetical protein
VLKTPLLADNESRRRGAVATIPPGPSAQAARTTRRGFLLMPSQSHLLDRQWLEGEYLPSLDGSVLFVGVRHYNAGYHRLVKQPALFETVDPDSTQSQYGAPIHYNCQAETLLWQYRMYDHVCCCGLFGMPDSLLKGPAVTRFLKSMAMLVKEGGTLLYGTSTDIMPMSEAIQLFDNGGFERWAMLKDWVVEPSPAHSAVLIRWVRKPTS